MRLTLIHGECCGSCSILETRPLYSRCQVDRRLRLQAKDKSFFLMLDITVKMKPNFADTIIQGFASLKYERNTRPCRTVHRCAHASVCWRHRIDVLDCWVIFVANILTQHDIIRFYDPHVIQHFYFGIAYFLSGQLLGQLACNQCQNLKETLR